MIARLLATVGILLGVAAVGVALLVGRNFVVGLAFFAIVGYFIVALGMTARAMTAAQARTTPLGILIV